MSNLAVIEYRDQRVLTTTQLAESYGSDLRRISENFNRNKERYKPGKHFFILDGAEKRYFLDHTQIADSSKNAQHLYLWTEKGAWMHAKSLNTDKAWDAYEMLVDDYYRKTEQARVLSEREANIKSLELTLDTIKRTEAIEVKVMTISEEIRDIKAEVERSTIDYFQQEALLHAKRKRVEQLWAEGEVNTDFYDTKHKLHSRAWSEFKRAFGVASYKDTPRKKFEEALKYLQAWRPSLL